MGKKRYDVEIAFSGGFVFLVDTDDERSRPKSADNVEVLVVPVDHTAKDHDLPKHVPQFLWRAKDFLGIRKGVPVDAAPDAYQHVCCDLPEKKKDVPQIEIKAPDDYDEKEFSLSWAPIYMGAKPRYPEKKKQDRYFDWIPDLAAAGLTSVDPARAAAKIALPAGKLRARAVMRGYRKEGGWRPLLWRYEDAAEGTGSALAHQVVLRLKGLEGELQVEGLGGPYDDLELHPSPGEVLRLAFTNLPEEFDPAGAMHFRLYQAIGDGKLRDLVEETSFFTPESTCPPTWFEK